MSSNTWILPIISVLTLGSSSAQSTQSSNEPQVKEVAGVVTLSTSRDRAMLDVISTLRDRYGWTVDYEEPAYSGSFEIRDAATPDWIALHPNAKHPQTLVETPFTTSFPEPSAASLVSGAGEESILRKVIADYNASDGPGYFQLEKISPTVYSIVGRGSKDSPGHANQKAAILDTQITIPTEQRTVGATLQLICQEVTRTTGTKLVLNPSEGNLLDALVTIGGESLSARELIAQTFVATRAQISVDTLYSIFGNYFAVNYEPSKRMSTDASRNKRYVLLPPLPSTAQK